MCLSESGFSLAAQPIGFCESDACLKNVQTLFPFPTRRVPVRNHCYFFEK